MSGASAWLEALAASGAAPRMSTTASAAAPSVSASAMNDHFLFGVIAAMPCSLLPPESECRHDSLRTADRFGPRKRRRARSRRPFFGGGLGELRVRGIVL